MGVVPSTHACLKSLNNCHEVGDANPVDKIVIKTRYVGVKHDYLQPLESKVLVRLCCEQI